MLDTSICQSPRSMYALHQQAQGPLSLLLSWPTNSQRIFSLWNSASGTMGVALSTPGGHRIHLPKGTVGFSASQRSSHFQSEIRCQRRDSKVQGCDAGKQARLWSRAREIRDADSVVKGCFLHGASMASLMSPGFPSGMEDGREKCNLVGLRQRSNSLIRCS